ncbi:MAG: hypothetical protein V1755_08175 [Chloroflexota bacterium]
MPAKKAAPKRSESSDTSDMGTVWKWVFVVGALVAGVAGAIGFANNILTWLLILAGVFVGLFWRDTDDLKGFGIRYLLLAAVAGALSAIPAIGGILTGFFQGFVGFLGPVALATLFMYFWKKYFATMM